jgi:5-methylcytosine-specific restriction endonuclease McrA
MPCSASALPLWPSTTPGHAARPRRSGCRRWWRCASTGVHRAARFNVFLRDRFTCQYCGEAFASPALTFEHVIPRSRGGQTTWSNIVTACVPCNTAKGNALRTQPRRLPKEPTLKELLTAKRAFPPGYLHESWTDYLYWDAQLEA